MEVAGDAAVFLHRRRLEDHREVERLDLGPDAVALHLGGEPVDRDVFEFYVRTLTRLSPGATWTGAGIGKDQLTLARWSLELGGHCRTGLEDNVRLDKTTLAPSNAALVAQVARLCEEYGRRPATAAEARRMLGLAPMPSAAAAA